MRGSSFEDCVHSQEVVHRQGATTEGEAADRGDEALNLSMGAYFGIGLAGGAGMGAVAFLAFFIAGVIPAINMTPLAETWAAWTSSFPNLAVAASKPVIRRAAEVDVFAMKLERAPDMNTRFPLQVVGRAELIAGVLLRGLPAGTQLSHGTRRDERTWAVKVAELANLELTLPENAPEVFDVRMDIIPTPGVLGASSIARVRVEDMAPVTTVATVAPAAPPAPVVAEPAVAAAPAKPVVTRTKAVARTRPPVEPKTRPEPTRVPDAAPDPAPIVAQVAAEPEERHFPEGASALGAISRASDRQVWWKLPPPAWSPFLDAAGR